ncbi:MAG TPA: MarR family transcriptional regulator [Woeseiaceae bacterium]|nr:MarR family transcriptional regulator [Woeseiaceae bacterium]
MTKHLIVETEKRRPETSPSQPALPHRSPEPSQNGVARADAVPSVGQKHASTPGSDVDGQKQTPAQGSMRYDLRILTALRRIIRSVELYSRHLSATNRITAPQLVCLLTIAARGAVTATTISREVHLSPSTVVGILDRLEEKGLVTRTRMRADRRLVQVSATPEGIALAQSAPSPLQKALAVALNRLPELEQATIALSLERIVALMEVEELDASPILATGPITPTAP